MLKEVPRRVVCVQVGPRVGMHALNHPSQHIVCVCGGKTVGVGGCGELPYGVVLKQGRRAVRCRLPKLLPRPAREGRRCVPVGVCHLRQETAAAEEVAKTVSEGGLDTVQGQCDTGLPVKDVVLSHSGSAGSDRVII